MKFESKQLLKCPGTGGGTALERGRGPFHKACDELAGISVLLCFGLFVDNPGEGSHVRFSNSDYFHFGILHSGHLPSWQDVPVPV